MPAKKRTYITITGRTDTEKTALMKLLSDTLRSHNFEVEELWGIDGEPKNISSELEQTKLRAIANKTKVFISEHNLNQQSYSDEPRHIQIEVLFDETRGYGIKLTIAGYKLENWWGNFPLSKDRALAAAARLSAEFDVEYVDMTPRKTEWVQPR